MKKFLDELHDQYHRPEYLASDPLELVHHYSRKRDQEAVALVAAVLAYGNVKQIRNSVSQLWERLEKYAGSPEKAVLRILENPTEGKRVLRGWVHRFNTGDDLCVLLHLLGLSWRQYGTLGAHLGQHVRSDDSDFSKGLSLLFQDWWSWVPSRPKRSFAYLLSDPKNGSTCKRWCMLMRWMVRKDGLDLGLWSEWVRPDQLVMPLDTHTGRISQYLGLTQRKSLNWQAALEVTEALKRSNAKDPVRYDFAICRLGILDLCKKKYEASVCDRCSLLPVCHFAADRARRSRGRSSGRCG